MKAQHGYYIEDVTPGLTASSAKTITDRDIALFIEVSGDDNPVHSDPDYAATTQFKSRIAHGMLTTSVMSSALSNQLPGYGSILLDIGARFRAPVYPGDLVETTVTVREVIPEKRRIVVDAVSSVRGNKVLEGQATLMLDARNPR